MPGIYQHIRSFWDAQPCGTTHLDLEPQSREYFIEFDKFFESFYPYYLPFIDPESMRGRRVMEIGLGSGFSLQRLAERAQSCIGLDLSGNTIELNQARARHFNLRITFVQASATEIPLDDNSLDCVVSVGCLHHIPDIQKAVDEIHRVLKPEGLFKGMVYNRNSYRYQLYIPFSRRFSARWRGKSAQDCINEMYDGAGNPYGMVYSRREVAKLFNKFELVHSEVQNFVGEEVSARFGGRIPRHVWLKTAGRIAGLDLYFTARAKKLGDTGWSGM
jgi:ubiquinone/menaquinone biosynthesis C-methylase UbiE